MCLHEDDIELLRTNMRYLEQMLTEVRGVVNAHMDMLIDARALNQEVIDRINAFEREHGGRHDHN